MNESITSLLIILSQIGTFFALVVVVIIFLTLRRNSRDKGAARDFVTGLKENELPRREKLMTILEQVNEMDNEDADKVTKTMMDCEKRIYNRVLRLFISHDRDALKEVQRDVENMAHVYKRIIDTMETVKTIERGDNPKKYAQFRAQIKQLENERDKLQTDLDEAMLSMDSMLKEYTQMYSGGGAKKEGLKHIENEMHQLKDKISKNLVEEVDENEFENDDNEAGENAQNASHTDDSGVPDLEPPDQKQE